MLLIVLFCLLALGIIFINLVDEAYLANMLVRNNLRKKELNQVAISAFNLGINQLRKQEVEHDSKQTAWYQTQEGKLAGIDYKIRITDIGSKLNVNYLPNELLAELDFWSSELEGALEGQLISELLFIKDLLGEDYQKATNKLTVYGKCNLNTASQDKLKNLLEQLELSSYEQNRIISYREKKQKEDQVIKRLNELVEEGLSMLLVERIEPYLTTKGQLNINFIPKQVLQLILNKELEMNEQDSQYYAAKIVDYRQGNEIRELAELKDLIYASELSDLEQYFTTLSRYFLLEIKVKKDNQQQRIKSVVKRVKEDGQWQLKILKWQLE